MVAAPPPLPPVLPAPWKAEPTAKELKAMKEQATPTVGPGLITPDMELFCKAAADGSALGDCPFTHYVQVIDHDGVDISMSRHARPPGLILE